MIDAEAGRFHFFWVGIGGGESEGLDAQFLHRVRQCSGYEYKSEQQCFHQQARWTLVRGARFRLPGNPYKTLQTGAAA